MSPVCVNQSSLSRHNFGGCLAKTANKGGISNSRYTRFERTYLIGCPSSNAGVVCSIPGCAVKPHSPMPDVDARLRSTSTKGALFLHVHPPSITHTHCVKGPSICANHTVAAVNSPIASSLYVAIECTCMMSMYANQSCLSGHDFGGCLATTANKGGNDSSRYTRLTRICPHCIPSSNA